MKQGSLLQQVGLDALLGREWLAANGSGGYACSTVPGLNTRKYHGLLVASMAPPVRRMVLLSRVEETLWCDRRRFALDCNEYPDVIYPRGQQYLREFQAGPPPRWIYEGEGWSLEKQLWLVRGQNTVVISYTLLRGRASDLQVRPLLALRRIHELGYQWNGPLASEPRGRRHHRIPATSRTPEVFFAHDGQFLEEPNWYLNQIYRREQQRGYAGLEDLWTPGAVRFHLKPGRAVHFVCSADPIDFKRTLRLTKDHSERTTKAAPADVEPPAAPPPDPVLDALYRAADAFVISRGAEAPADRFATCIAGYPWFTPGGRDALIAFTGLLLVPGRFDEARALLLPLVPKLRNGLLSSRLCEEGGPPVYHDADTSLWFINAMWDYLRYTRDDDTGRGLLDAALRIISSYRHGTDLGIRVDTQGLLASRCPGTPTTWMDARIGDWIITPRTGRPVELNALWYNAIRITAELCDRYDRRSKAAALAPLASSIRQAFNQQFWNEQSGCCYDVIDEHGRDPSVRPNQLLAISLPFAVLDDDKHERVLRKIEAELLTPRGVRTLSPADPGYQGRSDGDLATRERAYHNGSAFPWLLGPYVTAMLKVRGRSESARRGARDLIRPCIDYLMGEGTGQMCELFDGDSPHAPGGAIASAPAVAELLRCYAEDVLGRRPVARAIVSAPIPLSGAVTRQIPSTP